MNVNSVPFYAVKVNGTIVTPSYSDRVVAENIKNTLIVEAHTNGAEMPTSIEVVTVTQEGTEILLG